MARTRGETSRWPWPVPVLAQSVLPPGRSQLRATLPLYGLVVMGQPEVYLQFKPGLIDEHFEVTDEQSRGFLENFVDKFVEWIERHGQHHAVSVAAE